MNESSLAAALNEPLQLMPCDSDPSCTYASMRNPSQFACYIYCLILFRKKKEKNIVKYSVSNTNKTINLCLNHA